MLCPSAISKRENICFMARAVALLSLDILARLKSSFHRRHKSFNSHYMALP